VEKAVISAADKTGNVFDKIAAKLKGVEKKAKGLESIGAGSSPRAISLMA
jgi:hypothetical protein